MAFPDNVDNWFFIVDGSQIYHTGRGIYVPPSDAAYIAWQGAGNAPTAVSVVSLVGALSVFSLRPTEAVVLDAYMEDQAKTVVKNVNFKVMFNHENRLRAIERQLSLNGSLPNLSAAQALATVKGLM
jgi:hypothetical protein